MTSIRDLARKHPDAVITAAQTYVDLSEPPSNPVVWMREQNLSFLEATVALRLAREFRTLRSAHG